MKTKIDCDVILDLLPLYHDEVVSESTKKLIEEHLSECDNCRHEYDLICKDLPSTDEISVGKVFVNTISSNIQKLINGMFLFVILISTSLSWFGVSRGIQEIKGSIIFYNPTTILFLLILAVSFILKRKIVYDIMSGVGFLGILAIELWCFLTWYILTITGEFNLYYSFEWAYPEFYVVFVITFIACIINVINLIKHQKH
ncbi:MAG: zf-HC2 domain-containing protein [Clostridia bacterium]